MNESDTAERLRRIAGDWGFADIYSYNEEAFSRSLGFLDAQDMDTLVRSRVAIPGLGGVGGVHVITLARSGVGRFNLADLDNYEPANMNRQFGARVQNFGRSKLDVMVEEALSVNPFLDIKTFPNGVTNDNLDAFLDGVDVVLDGLDFFVFDVRRKLFKRAYELDIPVITAGPLGFSSALLVFTPSGMPFDEYFDIEDGMPDRKKYIHFALGLAPAALHSKYMDASVVDFDAGKGPSMNIGCQMCSALAGTEALRILLNRKHVKAAPYYVQFDPYRRRFVRGRLRKGNKSRLQAAKAWFFEEVLLKKARRIGCEPAEKPKTSGETTYWPMLLEYLVKAAVQAPSGDNIQPWRFVGGEETLDVYMDPEVDDSFFNVHNIATLIATGAAIENIAIAATACGLAAAISLFPEEGAPDLVAGIRLRKSPDVREDRLFGSIWRRNTNRKPFERKPLPDGICDRISQVAKESGGDLHWVNTPDELERLAKAVFIADRIRMEREDLHKHFIKMVRFSDEDAERTRDGLPLKNLHAGMAGELFLKATKSWKVMRVANALGAGKVGARFAEQGIINSGGAGLLTIPGMQPNDFASGGRALQRVWLTLTHYNLRMQPMTAVTLFRLAWLLDGPEVFSTRHQDMLRHVWSELETLYPEAWKRGPVMLFRAGFGKPIRYGTYRRQSDSFL